MISRLVQPALDLAQLWSRRFPHCTHETVSYVLTLFDSSQLASIIQAALVPGITSYLAEIYENPRAKLDVNGVDRPNYGVFINVDTPAIFSRPCFPSMIPANGQSNICILDFTSASLESLARKIVLHSASESLWGNVVDANIRHNTILRALCAIGEFCLSLVIGHYTNNPLLKLMAHESGFPWRTVRPESDRTQLQSGLEASWRMKKKSKVQQPVDIKFLCALLLPNGVVRVFVVGQPYWCSPCPIQNRRLQTFGGKGYLELKSGSLRQKQDMIRVHVPVNRTSNDFRICINTPLQNNVPTRSGFRLYTQEGAVRFDLDSVEGNKQVGRLHQWLVTTFLQVGELLCLRVVS